MAIPKRHWYHNSAGRLIGWLTTGPATAYAIPTHFLPLPPSPEGKLAVELGVSAATVDRYRNGHSPVSAPVQRLMAKTWPKWWDFLNEQSNVLPSPEPVRTEEG